MKKIPEYNPTWVEHPGNKIKQHLQINQRTVKPGSEGRVFMSPADH